MSELAKRVRQRREELGLTQEELANRLGYKSKTTIAKIESGTNDITQSKVVEFAKALNTTVAYLMGWEETTNENSEERLSYYQDELAGELAQRMFERPELRVLFDATKDVTKEDLEFIVGMVERMKK